VFYAIVYDDDNDDDAGLSSGVGTNLKVRGTCQAQSARNFFVVSLHFLALQVQLVVLHFRDGQHACSLVSLQFCVLLLSVPPCPAICKSGDTCPVPYGVGATSRWTVSHQTNSQFNWMQSVTRTIFPVFAFKVMLRVLEQYC